MTARLASLIGIAPEGAVITFGIVAVALITLIGGLPWLGIPLIVLAIAVGLFFRDPERSAAASRGAVISAADGKVCDVSEAPLPDDGGQSARRVAVFMSPLNVHVNRASIDGKVLSIEHTPGEFRAAYRDDANEHNEHNVIVMADDAGRRFAIVQIAGYLARRIVCRVKAGEHIDRGARIGLIMFGSRVDHFFPLDYRVKVAVGDRVRAGESVLAENPADGS